MKTAFLLVIVGIACLYPRLADADLVFTFFPVSGGTQTRVTLSNSGTTVATGNNISIADHTLPFDFVDSTVVDFEFPNPENFLIQGSVSGDHPVWRLWLDDDTATNGNDNLSLSFSNPLTAGETLTGSGTDVADISFSRFLNGGEANNPTGAPFRVVLSSVPEPSIFAPLGLAGLFIFGYRRRSRAFDPIKTKFWMLRLGG